MAQHHFRRYRRRPVPAAPAGRFSSTNPAHLDEVVADGRARRRDAPGRRPRGRRRQAQRAWAAVPAPVRGRAIAHIGRLVEANTEALARLVTREIGKPYAEALGEVQEIVDTCDFFLGEGRRLYGQTVPERDAGQAAVHVPQPGRRGRGDHRGQLPRRGAVLVHRARAAVRQHRGVEAGRVLAPLRPGVPRAVRAAAAGCRPACSTWSYADGQQTFAGLEQALDAGLVDKVGFTGSTEVGARIGELAGRHLQSACLELGGKNPMVVTPNADLDLAVEGALFSGFGTAGQRCTSLGTVIVHESVHDEFLTRFDRPRPRARRRRSVRRTSCTGRCWTRSSPTGSRSTWAGSRRTTRFSGRPASAGSPRRTRAMASSGTPRPACSTTR